MMMMVGAGAWAGDITITPADFTPAETSDYQTTKDGITVAVTASTVTSEQMRIFKNQTITISSTVGNISQIVFTCTANGAAKYGPVSFGAQEGYTFEEAGKTGTWTGSATEVTFKAETNQVRATEIVVTVGGGQVDTKTATVIEFAEGYTTRCTPGKDESVDLPVATVKAGETAVAGATVAWTSSDETMASIEGGKIKPVNGTQGSVTITASYAGNDTYKASTKSYTLKLYKGYVMLSALVEDLNSSNEKWDKGGELANYWMGEMVDGAFKPGENLVTYASGNYTYLTDGTNHLLFYGKATVFGNQEQTLKAGDKITLDYGHEQGFDAIWGKAYRYNKLPEFSVEQMIVRVTSENNAVAYTTITPDQLSSYINQPVKIENAVFEAANNKNLTFKVGEATLAVYNQFGVDAEALVAGTAYTLTGMGCIYKENYQLYLIDFKGGSANIEGVKMQKADGQLYNLNGQRVNKAQKGVYIQDGRKQLMK